LAKLIRMQESLKTLWNQNDKSLIKDIEKL